jgi:hypothetical protein
MTHTEVVPDYELERIAQQLAGPAAALLGTDESTFGFEPAVRRDELAIAESFPIWLLKEDALARHATTLSATAEATPMWHHQIKVGEQAVAYAESVRSDDGGYEFRALFPDDELAQAVDRAIDHVDRVDMPGDPEVRLLTAPAFRLTAFWLVGDGDSNVFVIEARGTEDLPLSMLSDSQFLEWVRRVPIVGGRTRSGSRGRGLTALPYGTDAVGPVEVRPSEVDDRQGEGHYSTPADPDHGS